MLLISVGALAFGLSFFFALGGVGSAVALVPALTVPFSSLTGFIAYTAMGSLNMNVCLTASVAALAGGMIGTRAMHRIDQRLVRLILALALMVAGVRIFWKMVG